VRPLVLGLVFAACSSRAPYIPPSAASRDLLGRARDAERRGDWNEARVHLAQAHTWAPDDIEVSLRFAEVTLGAFGEVDAARELYRRCLKRARHRALHGLGRCALVAGDRERALELFRESMDWKPTPACARDLAILLLSEGQDAGDALEAVESLSYASWESELLLAAAGRLSPPPSLPPDPEYALARARLRAATGDAQSALQELQLHFSRACANAEARRRASLLLRRDFAFRGNPAIVSGVISLELS